MIRCKHSPPLQPQLAKRQPVALQRASLIAALALGLFASPSWAQVQPLSTGFNSVNTANAMAQARAFPHQSLFGTLVVTDASNASINGKPYRVAPGMRLFSQNNTLVNVNLVAGERLKVRYLMETATGMLQTAWVLRESEIPPRRFFGLFGPDTQDPQEIQTGPLGVGLSKSGDAANASRAASTASGNAALGGR
ncbi:hypothetical protein [Lampropedia aestuarii]|uniref:hypothetical protein n=1 Tax=Lampropedia aestuarii TaxID=2562762 RepID=UPI0024691D6B|nr:hypothetical protein [Lampropedia aestuarii]MDH5858151.1 hypothetical protein [Lampropedia aestuarii]